MDGDSLDHFMSVWVRNLDCAGHIPGDVDHGNNGLDLFDLVPLKSLQSQLVLVGWE